jgi:choline dehydrogenase
MTYDVVVVGAGSAGCVLAARLSEDPSRSVLLLEAGPDYPDTAALPPEIASSDDVALTHDWGYASEPGALGRALTLPRAKLVGGCSATNATAAMRGATPSDYDAWAALGNPGWSFAEILPAFRRLEDDADFDDAVHGRGGPLPIRRARLEELTPLQRAFGEVCAAAGHPPVADHNAPGALGVGPWPSNGFGSVRRSAALTYLSAGVRARPNLTLRSGVLVDRVIFEGQRAAGVELAEPREPIRAGRVILAAGAYGSPAILLRSGLGRAADLRALDVPVVEDLPGVGQHLADHPLYSLDFTCNASEAGIPWLQMLLTWRSDAFGDAPGYDLHIMPGGPWLEGGEATCSLYVSLVKPRSHGRLRLHSADPTDAPLIDLGYFTNPDDLPRLVEAARLAWELAQRPPLADLLLAEQAPGPESWDTPGGLEAAIRAGVRSYHHPTGTCLMGPASDPMAVVDSRGRVRGVEGLSVVDASIMPEIPAGNTNLPTIMVAERCAAWLSNPFAL